MNGLILSRTQGVIPGDETPGRELTGRTRVVARLTGGKKTNRIICRAGGERVVYCGVAGPRIFRVYIWDWKTHEYKYAPLFSVAGNSGLNPLSTPNTVCRPPSQLGFYEPET